jgi:hypothetical protein
VFLNTSFKTNAYPHFYTIDDCIDNELQKEDEVLAKLSKYKYYITFVLEREIEIDESLIEGTKYLYMSRESIREQLQKFSSHTKQFVTYLVCVVSTIIDFSKFDKLLPEGIFIDSHRGLVTPIGEVEFEISEVIGNKFIDSLDFTELQNLISLGYPSYYGRSSWLKRPISLYVAMLEESDPMKKFLWGFLSLEILTNKLSDKLYDNIVSSLQIKDESSDIDTSVIENLVWKKERLPLDAKFTIVALKLNPYTANDDVCLFREFKEVRDNIAHGQVMNDVKNFPIAQIQNLLKRYFKIVFSTPSLKN